MAPTKVSTTVIPNRWTVEYRTTLHLLFTRFRYDGGDKPNRDTIARIFRSIFSNDLQTTHPDGVKDYGIVDDYTSRNNAGRSKIWHTIDTNTPSNEQIELRGRIMGLLRESIKKLLLDGEVKEIATQAGDQKEGADGEQEAAPSKERHALGATSHSVLSSRINGVKKQIPNNPNRSSPQARLAPIEEAIIAPNSLHMIRWTDSLWNSPFQAPPTRINLSTPVAVFTSLEAKFIA